MPDSEENIKICIIGGGPAGLCALRHISSTAKTTGNISVALFEQQNDIAGVWNYTGAEVKLWDRNGNPMVFPMYNDLRCNLPKQLMEFKDFKHKFDPTTTFITQQEMQEYLISYADKFQLWPYINVNQKIVAALPHKKTPDENYKEQWLVTVEDTKTFQQSTFQFDYVVSCVGVNFVPKVPIIPGIKHFHGNVLHSKYFKAVEEFKGKCIVLLGLGPSCADLCLKLSTVAKEVVACHRFPGGFSLGILPPNVRETNTIKKVKRYSVITMDGENISCDTIIFCTGYETQFPFLNLEESFDRNSKHVLLPSLYKRMFLPSHPSLCFINAHGFVSEFLVMEIQAKYFVSVLEGKVTLPPKNIMIKKGKHEDVILSKQGKLTESLRKGDLSALDEIQKYLTGLTVDGRFYSDFECIPMKLAVWQWVIQRIFGSLALYRNDKLNWISESACEYVCAGVNNELGTAITKIVSFNRKDGKVDVKYEN